MSHRITFLPEEVSVCVSGGTILEAQIRAGLRPDAPCGGRGTCGKCRVTVEDREILACQCTIDRDMTVQRTLSGTAKILTQSMEAVTVPDGEAAYVLAFDIGTTTLVGYLLEGKTGAELACASRSNPQRQFGADVISRIEAALQGRAGELQQCIRSALEALAAELAARSGVATQDLPAAIVGNTAMHHLLLGIDPKPLVTPPYMPGVYEGLELGKARILPNIAGFVGGDTVGCMTAARFDRRETLTLLIDIGTNGEMVLGNRHRRIACSTAAGPAFEGAKISCGMGGSVGAVDHVWLEGGQVRFHVLGEGEPKGLCGSGLLDLVAVLLDLGILDESGYLEGKAYSLCKNVTLTQKDVREVQLAKAAIRAGIELLAEAMGADLAEIGEVCLAGAFGNYMEPRSACRIGMIPPVLLPKIRGIGNAAGAGARLCALSRAEFEYSKALAAGTEFLELASRPNFQDRYVDALEFCEVDP